MSPRRAGPAALLLLAAAWLAAPAPLRAELGKPAMAVKFELAEENYRQALDDAQEAEIENAVEAGLVEALGARIGFIDFSQTATGNRLVVRLGKRAGDPGANGIRPIRFWISAEGDRVRSDGAPLAWDFRPLTRFNDSPGEPRRFVEEIVSKFAGQLESNAGLLVERVLSRVMLEKDAHPLAAHGRWVLPFTSDDLHIDVKSVFLIRATIRTDLFESTEEQRAELEGRVPPGSALPAELHSKILAKVVGEHSMQGARSVESEGIFVVVYRTPSQPALSSTLPAELDTGTPP